MGGSAQGIIAETDEHQGVITLKRRFTHTRVCVWWISEVVAAGRKRCDCRSGSPIYITPQNECVMR